MRLRRLPPPPAWLLHTTDTRVISSSGQPRGVNHDIGSTTEGSTVPESILKWNPITVLLSVGSGPNPSSVCARVPFSVATSTGHWRAPQVRTSIITSEVVDSSDDK